MFWRPYEEEVRRLAEKRLELVKLAEEKAAQEKADQLAKKERQEA